MWYKEGLRFQCTGCGQCCTGTPGYVWVEESEIQTLANHLHISLEECKKRYVRRIGKKYALLEKKAPSYDCIFLKDKRCLIYPVRPKQCRTFPWWPEHLKQSKNWIALSAQCEGINQEDAPLIPFSEIQRQLHIHNQSPDSLEEKTSLLYLIRHGETLWNKQQRLQGEKDSPLTELGEKQARSAGLFLKDLQLDLLCSSPLGRALQTAHIIQEEIGMALRSPAIPTFSDLRETSVGMFEGLSIEELDKHSSGQYFKSLSPEEQFYTPIALGAETRQKTAERALTCLLQIAHQHPKKKIGIVTHGGLIRALKSFLLQQYDLPKIGNCEISLFKASSQHLILEQDCLYSVPETVQSKG
jgi:uncharacterized protein